MSTESHEMGPLDHLGRAVSLSAEGRQKWEHRYAALEALRLTGNILLDAKAFFEVAGINPSSLAAPYAEAYKHGDRQLLTEYFQNSSTTLKPDTVQDAFMREYFTLSQKVRQAIATGSTHWER